jgi:hypothetical protein
MNPNEELESQMINPEEIPNNVFESEDAPIINLEEIENLSDSDYTEINPNDIPDSILD